MTAPTWTWCRFCNFPITWDAGWRFADKRLTAWRPIEAAYHCPANKGLHAPEKEDT